ncbi:hypothetical protein ACIRP2_36320 [Streptomyces sp. NPDC101194]|uniref:hypothetical protein n=1 Tax=Streptomyces sp. NPDC101194 TaxID=3366127 RepID=UPI003816724E
MTTSRNEETAAASEAEVHATAEATGSGETSVRTAPAAPAEEAAAPGATSTTTGGAEADKRAGKKAEKESGQESEEKAGSEPATAGSATAETPATAEAEAATATAEAEAEADATATATTVTKAPEKAGRPNKALLAGAAIAGVLLVTVPFLVHPGGGDDGRRATGNGEAPGTVLGSGTGDVPGAFASAVPSPREDRGKRSPAGKGIEEDGGPSVDGTHGSGPIDEGGDTAGAGAADRKPAEGGKTAGRTTTAGKTTTNRSGAGSTSTGTTQKAAPQSTVVYTGVAGHGCPTPAGGGFQQDGYYSDGSDGWNTRSSGGWTGNGCNGSYSAVPMSGDTDQDHDARVKWWWNPGTKARTCQISVYIPSSGSILDVGGHPTTYHVLMNANDRTTKYSSFRINQVAHRGQWVDAGTFAMKGATIGVKLLDRGDDWSKGWEKAHHAAAQMKVTCRS